MTTFNHLKFVPDVDGMIFFHNCHQFEKASIPIKYILYCYIIPLFLYKTDYVATALHQIVIFHFTTMFKLQTWKRTLPSNSSLVLPLVTGAHSKQKMYIQYLENMLYP
jgi:hypothetical protein